MCLGQNTRGNSVLPRGTRHSKIQNGKSIIIFDEGHHYTCHHYIVSSSFIFYIQIQACWVIHYRHIRVLSRQVKDALLIQQNSNHTSKIHHKTILVLSLLWRAICKPFPVLSSTNKSNLYKSTQTFFFLPDLARSKRLAKSSWIKRHNFTRRESTTNKQRLPHQPLWEQDITRCLNYDKLAIK